MSVPLSLKSLPDLPAKVGRPGYDRAGLKAGIVHFGVGNFHRSHQAVYLDDLFNPARAMTGRWSAPACSTARRRGATCCKAQDWLTTVVEQDAGHMQARVTGAMIDFLTPGDTEAIIEQLADPSIRIVSMTITEGGYFIDPASGKFNPTHPDIVADARNIASPKTVFGLILAGLMRRRDEGGVPFTVMSCDNIPHNGRVAADAIIGLALLVDEDLSEWVREHVAFPNGMVDRITPATSDRERDILEREFGVKDKWPVFCEPFRQWVLEDHFTDGRPALEKVGVQFVKDVSPFELMKIRILNGGHAVIAYPAGLMDIHFVHEAMEEPLVRGFLDKIEHDEIIPTVPPVPGRRAGGLLPARSSGRFSNPTIGDTIRRLCLDGSNRQPKFIVPTAADRLKAGKGIEGLALESALWCRYCFGTTDSGAVIEPNDPSWERMQATAKAARTDPGAWLGMADIYGDVGRSPVFAEAFGRHLAALWANGTRATLKAYLAGTA